MIGSRSVPVVAGLLVRDGHVLLAHRRADRRWFPDVWDLPGGHVEPGESDRDALVREIREELGVDVTAPTGEPRLDLTRDGYRLTVWTLTTWAGEVVNAAPGEHDRIGWFDAPAVTDLARAGDLAEPEYHDLLLAALA